MKKVITRIALAAIFAMIPLAVYASSGQIDDPNSSSHDYAVPVSDLGITDKGVAGGWVEGKGYFTVENGIATFSEDAES